jgi:hypothetical protein
MEILFSYFIIIQNEEFTLDSKKSSLSFNCEVDPLSFSSSKCFGVSRLFSLFDVSKLFFGVSPVWGEATSGSRLNGFLGQATA